MLGKALGSIRLGPRLYAISQEIRPSLTVADIGSDHVLLPLFLLEKQGIPEAIITELGDGPYKRAQSTIEKSPWRNCIQLRQGDGLQPLRKGEAGSVVIAGLGGDTITEILERDWQKAESFQHYVLQPMSRAAVLRECLAERGWPIERETLVGEKDKIFVIISVRPGRSPYYLSPLEKDLGPVILRSDSPWKNAYLQSWRKKYQKVVQGIRQAGAPEQELRLEEYLQKIEALEVMAGVSHS
ncbi:MAG TPA: class I SAM-dependent methyltransferase [Syntrophomonadaceae bacterium]|nr:class I SAM-dependent methyltransferase [Syntrophomonadaceae bacterium]